MGFNSGFKGLTKDFLQEIIKSFKIRVIFYYGIA